ncbi:hypothetical protein CN907_10145 [Bacillus anthracis]|nr:hypothetical protein CN907_10145 [Bacillus anthracis]
MFSIISSNSLKLSRSFNLIPPLYIIYHIKIKKVVYPSRREINDFFIIYPALTGSKTPSSKFSEDKGVRWGINCP